jgi:hypothetical protein
VVAGLVYGQRAFCYIGQLKAKKKKKKKKKQSKANGLEIEACRAAPDPVPQNLTEEPFSGSKALALMRGLVHGWLMENVKAEVKRK